MYKGHLDGAIACYKKAIELDPKDAMAHNNLGIAHDGKGQVDEAIACTRRPSNSTRSSPWPITTWAMR